MKKIFCVCVMIALGGITAFSQDSSVTIGNQTKSKIESRKGNLKSFENSKGYCLSCDKEYIKKKKEFLRINPNPTKEEKLLFIENYLKNKK